MHTWATLEPLVVCIQLAIDLSNKSRHLESRQVIHVNAAILLMGRQSQWSVIQAGGTCIAIAFRI